MTKRYKITPQEYAEAQNRLQSPAWRVQNLYHIVNKQGQSQLIVPNWAQKQLWNNIWYCNIILKARQLGISTWISLILLDKCLFLPNTSAGIVAHTVEDGQQLFRRIKYAYDHLPDQIRSQVQANNDTAQMLAFENGSSIRVGTSMRSSTCQYLHVSEFGKICAHYPEKAREIITGSLNTVTEGQYIFIESTAEGREGPFFDLCKRAEDDAKQGKQLTKLDFRFHFFPWWQEPSYRIGSPVTMTSDLANYFVSLEAQGIHLSNEQRWWYAAKASIQGDDMMREFPSTPSESFEVSHEGLYYGRQMSCARSEGRVTRVRYDDNLLVHTAWDLGYNDSTAIWFVQLAGKEIHVIDYLEGSGESMAYWIDKVLKKPYTYGKHLAPHDIKAHEYSSGQSRIVIARKLGIQFIPVPRVEVITGIDAVRNILSKCWFDSEKCVDGIKALDNYKKIWDERLGCWAPRPLHSGASHGCFVGDTLIHCIEGDKQIKDIGIGDMVKTPNGYKKVLRTFQYQAEQLLQITTNRSCIVCTNNHKVFAVKGLVFADALRYNDIVYTDDKTDVLACRKFSLLGGTNNIGFRESFLLAKMNSPLSLMGLGSGGMDFIIKEIQTQRGVHSRACIEPFGLSIMEKYQKCTISTTLMETPKIMTSVISSVSTKQNIYVLRQKEISGLVVRGIDSNCELTMRRPSFGTLVRRALNGIVCMGKRPGKLGSPYKEFARCVAVNTKHSIRTNLDFAIPTVSRNSDIITQRNLNKSAVIFVGNSSLKGVGQSKGRVLKIVPIKCNLGQKVYDFEVEGDHCYYANGILVSNSDAFRYLVNGLSYITNTVGTKDRLIKELDQLRDESGLLPGNFLYNVEIT